MSFQCGGAKNLVAINSTLGVQILSENVMNSHFRNQVRSTSVNSRVWGDNGDSDSGFRYSSGSESAPNRVPNNGRRSQFKNGYSRQRHLRHKGEREKENE